MRTTITSLKPGTSCQVRTCVSSGREGVLPGLAWERTYKTTGTRPAPALESARVRGARCCSADGGRLERALTCIVPGPPTLLVADARAQEGTGATVDFAVTLSRATWETVTERYATRDGTAKKGED